MDFRNSRPLPLLACLLALAPSALAHDPPGPVLACEAETAYHDYVGSTERPFFGPALALVADGSVEPCDPADPASRLDYDGDLDVGLAATRLFVLTGDGVGNGVAACHGAASTGHHSDFVQAWDEGGFGPSLVVTADASRIPPLDGPDCGDGYLEPCDLTPAERKSNPFPYSVVKDIALNVLRALFGPDGALCSMDDRRADFLAHPSAPSGGWIPFPPGADGTYLVEVASEPDWPLVTTAGHVWTVGAYTAA